MRVHVVTDKAGRVLGTLNIQDDTAGQGAADVKVFLEGDQQVHEIELPSELQRIQDVEELHEKLAKHLRRGQ